jgi:hypothetical protein
MTPSAELTMAADLKVRSQENRTRRLRLKSVQAADSGEPLHAQRTLAASSPGSAGRLGALGVHLVTR